MKTYYGGTGMLEDLGLTNEQYKGMLLEELKIGKTC